MDINKFWENRRRVLGINERNLTYVKKYNKKKAKKIADNKLLTKKYLDKAEIPNPKLVGVIRDNNELKNFDWDKLPKSFVIKPVSGLEGGGIEIFFNRDNEGNWIKADGSRYNLDAIKTLAADIVDGKYSLHNQPDKVFFEERIRMHKGFQYYAYKGVPDIRVIVFNNIPVMAMLRLPTKQSDGKGNLQMGAVGAGIDISTGVTQSGVIGKSQTVEYIPGTKLSVSGLKIPYWERILRYAVEAQKATSLNFAGIDFLIDRDKGPMIIELNARPGLSIQIANQDGLRWRLRKARGIKVQSVEKGIRLGKDLFGGGVAEDIERISGKSLIGIYENVEIMHAHYHDLELSKRELAKLPSVKTKAKIDTGADSTSIDISLAEKLGYDEYIKVFEDLVAKHIKDEEKDMTKANAAKINEELEASRLPLSSYCDIVTSSHGKSLRLYITIIMSLGGIEFETYANLYNRAELKYKIIVGRKSLNKFLVEPTKKS